MTRSISWLVLVAALASSCGGPSGRRLSAGEYLEEQRADARAQIEADKAARDVDGVPGDVDLGFAESPPAPLAASTVLALEEAEYALSELLTQKQRLALEHAVAGDEASLTVASSERSLRHATEDLQHFQAVEVERRLQEDALEVAEVRDAKDALASEIAELERLYGGPDVQAPGARAALDRARRELVRAEERLALRMARSADLRERDLPRTIEDLAAAVEAATTAHESALRLAQAGALERASEIGRLEREEALLRQRLAGLGGLRTVRNGSQP